MSDTRDDLIIAPLTTFGLLEATEVTIWTTGRSLRLDECAHTGKYAQESGSESEWFTGDTPNLTPTKRSGAQPLVETENR